MSFVGPIIGSVFGAGLLLTLLGPLVFAIDRRALREGNTAAFRRGVLMMSSQSRRAAHVVRISGMLRTAEGEGQWLSDDVFGFWSVANYRRSSYYLGWVGTATMIGEEVLFEVRLLRGTAIQQAGSLLAVSAFAVLSAVAWETFKSCRLSGRPTLVGVAGAMGRLLSCAAWLVALVLMNPVSARADATVLVGLTFADALRPSLAFPSVIARRPSVSRSSI